METLVAVAGTLIGAAIGVLGSYRTQRLSLAAQENERDRMVRQEAYSAFLSMVHEMFEEIRGIQRSHRYDQVPVAEVKRRLRGVSPTRAQISLERLRFVASNEVAVAAADLWEQMRRSTAAKGSDLSVGGERAWRDSYWSTRRRLIDAARRDTGREALDWQTAGVGPAPR